jgi:predicted DNA-binding protein
MSVSSVSMLTLMIRTQIQLTEEQARRLKRLAAERGVSIATVVRESVDQTLERASHEDRRARAIRALRDADFRSGHADVAERHDDYLAEDFG